jgi:glycosyltransferase involved in cell wall biosynthesis
MTESPRQESKSGPKKVRSGTSLDGVRIAIDARSLGKPGMGIHSYLAAAIKLLVEEGGNITLLANFDLGESAAEFENIQWESFGSPHDIVWDQVQLPKYLRGHSFHFYWAPGNFGTPWRSTGETIKVCTIHDIIPLRLPRMYLYRNPRFALPYLLSTVSSMIRSDILLTVSESSARDIFKKFRKRPIVIPSMLSRNDCGAQAGLLPRDPLREEYIIYTGGMDARKNLRMLLEGFALARLRLPELQLVIIGHSTDHLKPIIKELGLAGGVILTGFVSEQEKCALLKGARALVYPSLYEGFGLPILEAFDADVPVITCRNSSLVEVAGDAAVYVLPDSPSSIADGIVLILHEDVAERVRALGRARLAMYDPLIARRKLVDIFANRSAGL